MDIFNRPPAISEDTLLYTIYPARGAADRAAATSLATVIQAHVEAALPGHLWHRDPFETKVVPDPDRDAGGWMLEGRMRVGDCVDDEWCVVWLLREISAKWDVAISVCDSDGEFLLIEAAESLPSWVTPTNAENRVWIYAHQLHLIPLSHVSPPSSKRRRRRYPSARESDDEGEDDGDDYLGVKDALNLVRDSGVTTRAPSDVEKTIWSRIAGYPEAARQHVHTAKVYIPLDVARALDADPTLVQKPVETFYTRDALQLRAAHRMTRFPPEPSVLRTVKMTRTAYAQLIGQKFNPPKIFGRWKEREGSPEWRWRDVGMKIACGFEMTYQESKNRNEGTVPTSESVKASADARKEALQRNPDYVKYIETLVGAGYFQSELRGSQKWSELEDKAVATFVAVRREDDANRPSFAALVSAAVSRAPPSAVQPSAGEEDSDSWLDVDATDFDAMLEKTMGAAKPKAKAPARADADAMDVDSEAQEELVAHEQAGRLQSLAKKVEEFVGGTGDVDGAKFADEDSDDDGEMSDFSEEKFSDSDNDSDDGDAEDGNPAAAAARNAAREADMAKLVPPLAASDYGVMPASYHANSQRVARAPPPDADTDGDTEAAASASANAGKDAPVTMRPPILPRDEYEGVVDSDDESDEEDAEGDEEEEEDRPQVVGEMEVDMEEEEEEFLEFSRQALGITDAQWGEIISDRRARGAFIPATVKADTKSSPPAASASSTESSAEATGPARTDKDKDAADAGPRLRAPQPGPRPNVNPNLDSFEAVMQAMDAELARQKGPTGNAKGKGKASVSASAGAPPKPARKTAAEGATPAGADTGKAKAQGKGKGKATVSFADSASSSDDDDDMDIEAAMHAELGAALKGGFGDEGDSDNDMDDGAGVDYNLIKNFLESFKSQAGLAGPVGNLAGRLQPGWTLPRDEA